MMDAIQKAAEALAQLSDAEWLQGKRARIGGVPTSAPSGICPVNFAIESRRDDHEGRAREAPRVSHLRCLWFGMVADQGDAARCVAD